MRKVIRYWLLYCILASGRLQSVELSKVGRQTLEWRSCGMAVETMPGILEILAVGPLQHILRNRDAVGRAILECRSSRIAVGILLDIESRQAVGIQWNVYKILHIEILRIEVLRIEVLRIEILHIEILRIEILRIEVLCIKILRIEVLRKVH
ncbi:hypothetical protein HG530_013204 [Fusarium avenaceum]|nr:hypothetical protein HG530_013204 [Fusarium avenaceum]